MALPIYTHIPNLKVRVQKEICSGGVTVLNPKYPRLSSGDTITHRKRYIKRGDKKSEKSDKNDDIDAELLGDNSIDCFGGYHAELEVAAEPLFTSPPRPQPLAFKALPL